MVLVPAGADARVVFGRDKIKVKNEEKTTLKTVLKVTLYFFKFFNEFICINSLSDGDYFKSSSYCVGSAGASLVGNGILSDAAKIIFKTLVLKKSRYI